MQALTEFALKSFALRTENLIMSRVAACLRTLSLLVSWLCFPAYSALKFHIDPTLIDNCPDLYRHVLSTMIESGDILVSHRSNLNSALQSLGMNSEATKFVDSVFVEVRSKTNDRY